ncbi:hypothetical protein [Streptomyces adustus]|uniref:hypothetical protein n=1 Tax=Streptomyces adustus TaxID=1609272 RepID=UPI00371D1E2F
MSSSTTASTARLIQLSELTDLVLCPDGPVTSLVELTLTTEHRRGHGGDGRRHVYGRGRSADQFIPDWPCSFVAALETADDATG